MHQKPWNHKLQIVRKRKKVKPNINQLDYHNNYLIGYFFSQYFVKSKEIRILILTHLESLEDNYFFLEGIFREIYNKLPDLNVQYNAEQYLEIIKLLDEIFTFRYVLKYFVAISPLFINNTSGADLQNQTIFG